MIGNNVFMSLSVEKLHFGQVVWHQLQVSWLFIASDYFSRPGWDIFLTARNNTAAANRKTSRYRKNYPVL